MITPMARVRIGRLGIFLIFKNDLTLPLQSVFQSERIDSLSGTPLEEKPLFKEMNTLAKKVLKRRPAKDEVAYSVFRRTTPTISAQLPGSAPSWGIGAEVAFSEGPFPADNGLSYWFDLYIIFF